MAKPFDLEKAKAGAKVLYDGQEAHYIGKCQTGTVVIESVERDKDGEATWMYFVDQSLLSMAPVKVVKYVNLYRETNVSGEYSMYESKDAAVEAGIRCGAFVVAYPVEVEE